MNRALALARRGSGLVSPNPSVGAVVVKESKIVGIGWHGQSGALHAEVLAIREAGALARNATLYVTLEPCNHYGKTPPCVDAIIESGISRVVYAMDDPNPNVVSGGARRLREKGIEVQEGVLREKARELNVAWLNWLKYGKPLVVIKMALSLDACSASGVRGDLKWISSSVSRAQVHRMRRQADAIMVGSKTVLTDDPMLTNRSGKGPQPLRVIIDSELSIPLAAQVYKGAVESSIGTRPANDKAVVFASNRASSERREEYERAGIEVVALEDFNGRLNLGAALEFLGKRGIQFLVCEGGGEIATSLIVEGLANRLILYYAPFLIGNEGLPFFRMSSGRAPSTVRRFKLLRTSRVANDILAIYDVSATERVGN